MSDPPSADLESAEEPQIHGDWCVYILRCADNSFYCGITRDLEARLSAHQSGRGARYTRGRGPLELVAKRSSLTRSQAASLEWHVKRQARSKKVETLLLRAL